MNNETLMFENRRDLICKADEFAAITVKVYLIEDCFLSVCKLVGSCGGGDHPYFEDKKWVTFREYAQILTKGQFLREAIDEADKAIVIAHDYFKTCEAQGGAQ